MSPKHPSIMSPPVSIVVAFSTVDFAIGKAGGLPWVEGLPGGGDHLRWLAELTGGGVIVMGRRTYESIDAQHRPLAGRLTVVVTQRPSPPPAGLSGGDVVYVGEAELDGMLACADAMRPWFVIGGERLYERFLGRAQTIYATLVDAAYEGCDRFFPVREGGFEAYDLVDCRVVAEETKPRVRLATYTLRPAHVNGHGHHPEHAYLNLMRDVLTNGERRADRTGTGTVSVFGRQLRFDLRGGRLPLLTTRFAPIKMVLRELLWFARGQTDAGLLRAHGVRIWDGNTSRDFLDGRGLQRLPEGDIGAGYGFQWRHFGAAYRTCKDDYAGQGVDQVAEVLRALREDPMSRRICLTAWNPAALGDMALPPCHACFVQFYVAGMGGMGTETRPRLCCHMYQRSVDVFLGLAANIPSYSALTMLLAAMCGYEPGELVISTGDTHLYLDHIEQARTQLERAPLPLPLLRVDPRVRDKSIDEVVLEDFELVGYVHQPRISAPMSV